MTIDSSKWTSDWAVGREIAGAFADSGHEEFCILCIGDASAPSGFLVEPVGDALAKYHPDVFGTSRAPLHAGNFSEQLQRHGPLWRSRFTLVIAPKGGLAAEIGMIVPSRMGWTTPDGTATIGDMTLHATIFFTGMEDAGVPANPHLERRAHQAAHMLVDGVLRFFHRIEYDHTEFEQQRG